MRRTDLLNARLTIRIRLLLILVSLSLVIGSAGTAESLPEMQFHQVALISAN